MIDLDAWREGRMWRTMAATVHLFGQVQVEQRAAAFSYYALFSLFPLLALFLTIGSLFFSPEEITHAVGRFAPVDESQQNMIWQMVESLQRARGGVGAISLGVFLWASLRFFQALVRGVHRAWHPDELPWWKARLKNLLMIVILASALLLGILAPALLQGFRDAAEGLDVFLNQHFPELHLKRFFPAINLGRFAIGTVVLFYAVSMLYMLAPRRRIRFRRIWAVVLLVTVLLQLSQILFVNYLPHIVNYNAIYGTVGGIMFLLLWIYVIGTIILGGGCLCAAKVRVWDGEEIDSMGDGL